MDSRSRCLPLIALLGSLCGCPSAPAGGPASTDSSAGTWSITIDDTDRTSGAETLELTVSAADSGAVAPGLTVIAELDMPAMGHGTDEPSTVTEDGDGLYLVGVFFQMGGAWTLSGSISDGAAPETFSFDLDVVDP